MLHFLVGVATPLVLGELIVGKALFVKAGAGLVKPSLGPRPLRFNGGELSLLLGLLGTSVVDLGFGAVPPSDLVAALLDRSLLAPGAGSKEGRDERHGDYGDDNDNDDSC